MYLSVSCVLVCVLFVRDEFPSFGKYRQKMLFHLSVKMGCEVA